MDYCWKRDYRNPEKKSLIWFLHKIPLSSVFSKEFWIIMDLVQWIRTKSDRLDFIILIYWEFYEWIKKNVIKIFNISLTLTWNGSIYITLFINCIKHVNEEIKKDLLQKNAF